MKLSLSQQPPQTINVRHLIRHFDPQNTHLPPAKWGEVPYDIMREVSKQMLTNYEVRVTAIAVNDEQSRITSFPANKG
jgi:hypothetical protein